MTYVTEMRVKVNVRDLLTFDNKILRKFTAHYVKGVYAGCIRHNHELYALIKERVHYKIYIV